MEPRGRDGVYFQRFEGHRAKDAVAMGRKEGVQNLPEPIIIEGHAGEVGLEEGPHTPLFPPLANLREPMMPVQHRQHQSLHAPSTRQHGARAWGQERVDDRGHLKRAQQASHQRKVRHRRNRIDPRHHDVPPERRKHTQHHSGFVDDERAPIFLDPKILLSRTRPLNVGWKT